MSGSLQKISGEVDNIFNKDLAKVLEVANNTFNGTLKFLTTPIKAIIDLYNKIKEKSQNFMGKVETQL